MLKEHITRTNFYLRIFILNVSGCTTTDKIEKNLKSQLLLVGKLASKAISS